MKEILNNPKCKCLFLASLESLEVGKEREENGSGETIDCS